MKRIIAILVFLLLSVTIYAQTENKNDEPYFAKYYYGLTPDNIKQHVDKDRLTFYVETDTENEHYAIVYFKDSDVTPLLILYFNKNNRCVMQIEPFDNKLFPVLYTELLNDESYIQTKDFMFMYDFQGKAHLIKLGKDDYGNGVLIRKAFE